LWDDHQLDCHEMQSRGNMRLSLGGSYHHLSARLWPAQPKLMGLANVGSQRLSRFLGLGTLFGGRFKTVCAMCRQFHCRSTQW
jgi:hypothetical protein